MERIKQALERARAERSGQPAAPIPVDNGPEPAVTETPVEQVAYSQTRHIEVSAAELRAKRVVTGFDPCTFTDAYKMLRTQVLQRLNENNWNVLAVTSPGTISPAPRNQNSSAGKKKRCRPCWIVSATSRRRSRQNRSCWWSGNMTG